MPDTQWHQAQLCPKLGGLGLRSLSLHSCAAFISSPASDLGSPTTFTYSKLFPILTPRFLHRILLLWRQCLTLPLNRKSYLLNLRHPHVPSSSFFCFTSQQSSHVVSICPPCKFLGLCHPLCRLEHAPRFRRVPSGYQMVARPRHINCFFLPLLPWGRT